MTGPAVVLEMTHIVAGYSNEVDILTGISQRVRRLYVE